jgi:hypothetical protein
VHWRLWSTIATAVLAASLLGMEAIPARAQGSADKTPRLIIKLRSGGERAALGPRERVALVSTETGVPLVHERSMAFGYEVVSAFRALPVDEARAAAAKVARHPDVELAAPDYLRRIDDPPPRTVSRSAPEKLPFVQKLMPNDELLQFQTYLDDSPGGINAFAAWDITTGSASTVIAVVDTGITHHVDLGGRVVGGYNFISNPLITNGGPTRGPDFYDYGSWVTQDDLNNPAFVAFIMLQNLLPCPVQDSSWHGTAVTGIIAATANNSLFLAGLNWVSPIVVARFAGKCDAGPDSDQLDAMAWAAGLSVPGVPDNPDPAQIINMSAGASLTAECNPLWQGAVDQIFAHGVTRAFVASAGNAHADVATATPGSCNGVIAVAATDREGGLASYSNFGAGITISAPGGDPFDFSNSQGFDYGITTLWDTGTTAPARDSYNFYSGTSFAAPMVSGVISLMLAVAPNLTSAQIVSILKSSAKPFPTVLPALAHATLCTTSICGAGILDAHAAVAAAQAMTTGLANYQGLWWAAPAASESGWGINFAHQADTIFASWFTYDAGGKGLWLVMTAPKTAPNTYAGTLYSTTGPAFNAVPFNPANVVATAVGNGTLTFADANDGSFAYTVNGISQMKPITREVFGTLPACATATGSLAAATNYTDLWWAAPAGSESGWGINLNHEGTTIFATWFTYAQNGTPMWLVVTAPQTAPGVYAGTLYQTTGPAFNAVPFNPANVVATAVGTATFTFSDGNNATFAYTVNGIAQMKAITREIFAGAGTVCQ